jgi:D-alanine-D-alanine ligase
MRVGLAYDLKDTVPQKPDTPKDALEEYDSPETVSALSAAIESLGHSVVKLGGGRELINNILQKKVDIVFNIAEGIGNYRSREAQVPGIFEMLDIPYSGSDPQCLAICLDKPLSKKLVSGAGIPTPKWHVVENNRELNVMTDDNILFPAFIKPAHEGSSMGIDLSSKVDDIKNLKKKTASMLECYQQPVLIEEFISGDDITVGIIGNDPPTIFGIMRVLPRKHNAQFFYSLETKRNWEQSVEYECPAKLPEHVLKKIKDYSIKVYRAMGCRDFARVDFKLASNIEPFFLEINPLPGLNRDSGDLPIMAYQLGWTYEKLISAILNAAIGRYPKWL